MKKNISNIKALPDVYVFHAKTTNIYELSPKDYKRLLNENITKSSEKSPTRLEKSKNLEAKKIGKGIKQDDWVKCMAKALFYITLKGIKDNFKSAHPCSLIKPCKVKISKSILENRNNNLVKLLQVNQRKILDSLIKWFNSVEDKSLCSIK